MSSEYIFELLISIAHNADLSEFADYNMVTLDILHLIFRGVKPSDLMIPDGKIDKVRNFAVVQFFYILENLLTFGFF